MLLFLGALVTGHGIYWFVSGQSADHTTLRNALVVVQIFIGPGIFYYGVKLGRKQEEPN